MLRILACFWVLIAVAAAQEFRPVTVRPPRPVQEFRGAWVAVVHNIDWPSRKGLSAAAQQSEMRRILDRAESLNLNAIVFQVRPHCDAVYASKLEPWSPWLSGTMGKSPGYDPLQSWIAEAHRRGIELHAWFNPFRALSNVNQQASPDHVTRAAPGITKRYGKLVWCDPAAPETRQRAMAAILDVVRRYDVDGVHLDDYFYPYPSGGKVFPDGRSPAQRREIVDGFVHGLYRQVKAEKPWVRVGISPFGIWRPGVPAGIEAGLDAYEQLGADARKWLAQGWVDYLVPQLYWSDQPRKQSFSVLLAWWRQQGDRPVWPGIASARIGSTEDPGRKADEILKQVGLSRSIGEPRSAGQVHWHMSALMDNRGGIADQLKKGPYAAPALVPPMPGAGVSPRPPLASVRAAGDGVMVEWSTDATGVTVVARYREGWRMASIERKERGELRIPIASGPDVVAVSAFDRYGRLSAPVVLGR